WTCYSILRFAIGAVVVVLDQMPPVKLTFIFFFQAEDGIRDATVTGVQTCALPILAAPRSAPEPELAPPGEDPFESIFPGRVKPRSEERRVGKECRSRRLPYQ